MWAPQIEQTEALRVEAEGYFADWHHERPKPRFNDGTGRPARGFAVVEAAECFHFARGGELVADCERIPVHYRKTWGNWDRELRCPNL